MGHAAWIIKADWVIWKVKMFLLRGQWEGLSWKWKHLRLNWKSEMLLAFHFSSATWGSWWSRWPTLSPQEWSLAGQASWIWSSLQQKSVRWVKHTHAHTHAWTHYIYLEPEVGFETLKRWICLECVYIFYLMVRCKFYSCFKAHAEDKAALFWTTSFVVYWSQEYRIASNLPELMRLISAVAYPNQ